MSEPDKMWWQSCRRPLVRLSLVVATTLLLITFFGAQRGPRGDFSSQLHAQSNRSALSNGAIRQRILNRQALIVGVQEQFAPFHFADSADNGGRPGLDVELATLLAESLEVSVELRFLPLADLLEAAAAGTIDLAFGGISATLERSRKVLFSDPYVITTPGALVQRSRMPSEPDSVDYRRRPLASLADLRHFGSLTIGVMANTTHARLLVSDSQFERHRVREYHDREQLIEDLARDRIDAMVADGIAIQSLLRERSALESRLYPLTHLYLPEHIAVALPRGDMEWVYDVNFFIKELRRTGRHASLLSRYGLSEGGGQ